MKGYGCLVWFLLAILLTGADGSGDTPSFLGKVTLAYGLLFTLVILYLVMSQRKNAGLKEELEFLERRLAELDKQAPRKET
ncbi:MAG: hypothetical protein V3T77_10700 [Planctomycetota bacterium]